MKTKPIETKKLETLMHKKKFNKAKKNICKNIIDLFNVAWAFGAGLNYVYISCETPLKKINSSFVSGCQLETASRLEMGACVQFHSQHGDVM